MGTISSGIGLMSGLDTASIIDQLMAIEARPRQLVERQVGQLQAQKTAFLDINAKLLALKSSSSAFLDNDSFGARKTASTNPDVLSASAEPDAPLGTYTFGVSRLVSTHQLISRGFTDADQTEVGLDTSIRIESAAGRLDREVELADLNGFAGVDRGRIRITDRSGSSAEIDLSRALTLDEVLTRINTASGVNVTASIDGDRLVVTDNTGATASDLIVGNVGGRTTASDLGIAGNSSGADTIAGTQINSLGPAASLQALNDGLGVRVLGADQSDLQITDGTSTFDVSLDDVTTVQGVLDAINNATDNTSVTASIAADGVSLQLDGAGAISVAALGGSTAAADLGIEGSGGASFTGERLLAGLNSKLIRNIAATGPIDYGTVSFDTGSGPQSVDLSVARSFSDVIDRINAAGAGVTAALNDAGHGIAITADNGAELTVADASGNLAASLNLAGTHSEGVADSGDLDVAYINQNTRLDSLNGGAGVKSGKFIITDSTGASATVDLTQGESTLGQVIADINSRGIGVTASINATGDGLLLTDTAGGTLNLTVAEDGSTTAADLGLLGEDTDGLGYIDGSFERSVDIQATDTLQDVVDKLNAADVGLDATLINDGSATSPFRVSLSSQATGRDGRVLIDDGGLGLGAQTLVEGRDAVVFFGSADPAEAVLLTSSTNSLTDTIKGVNIDLAAASDQPVSLTLSRDTGQIVSAVEKFVGDYNKLMDKLNQLDSYDAETEERGLLLGDPTVAAVRRQMRSAVTGELEDVTGRYTRLFEVGVTVGADNKLEFDSEKLRDAMARDLDAVTELFTLKTQQISEGQDIGNGVSIPGNTVEVTERGFGATLEAVLDRLTDSISGTLTAKTNNLDSQIDLAGDRIDYLNVLLTSKRQQLEQQFAAMETTLAQLQNQQSALSSLANLAAGFGT